MPRAILPFVGAYSTSLNQTKYSIYRPGKQSACRPEKDDLKTSGVPQNAQELVKHCHPAGCLAYELCWYFHAVETALDQKKEGWLKATPLFFEIVLSLLQRQTGHRSSCCGVIANHACLVAEETALTCRAAR